MEIYYSIPLPWGLGSVGVLSKRVDLFYSSDCGDKALLKTSRDFAELFN